METKEAQGKLTEISNKIVSVIDQQLAERVDKKLYSIKVGNRFYSGFEDNLPDNFNELQGKWVICTYVEKENPKNKDKPYKNIRNIVEGVSPEELKETDEQYNVKPVGEPTTPKDEVNYNDGAFWDGFQSDL